MDYSLSEDGNLMQRKKQNREAIFHKIKDFGKRRQDYSLYGTKITNYKTKEIGLLICTWTNKFVGIDVDFATCVDPNGKRYNIAMDFITPFEE